MLCVAAHNTYIPTWEGWLYLATVIDCHTKACIGYALAESTIGLYKTECVRHDGPWRGLDDLELATLSWVHWFNHHRLHSKIGNMSPVEREDMYYRHNPPAQQPLAAEPSLH